MGEAYLSSRGSNDYLSVIYYVGNGPIYESTYSAPRREIPLGISPKAIQLLGYTGNSLDIHGGFTGTIFQGEKFSLSSLAYIELSGSTLYVMSLVYTANAGFQFHGNDPGANYSVIILR